MLVAQILWYARAARLQADLNLRFHDLSLLRRAFVHPSAEDRPELAMCGGERELARAGMWAGCSRRMPEGGSARSKGLRSLVPMMETRQLPVGSVTTSTAEYHNQASTPYEPSRSPHALPHASLPPAPPHWSPHAS